MLAGGMPGFLANGRSDSEPGDEMGFEGLWLPVPSLAGGMPRPVANARSDPAPGVEMGGDELWCPGLSLEGQPWHETASRIGCPVHGSQQN